MMNYSIFLTVLSQGPISDPNQFNNYLVLGYFMMWLIGFIYVVSLATRQRNTQKDVEMLQQLLREDEDTAV